MSELEPTDLYIPKKIHKMNMTDQETALLQIRDEAAAWFNNDPSYVEIKLPEALRESFRKIIIKCEAAL